MDNLIGTAIVVLIIFALAVFAKSKKSKSEPKAPVKFDPNDPKHLEALKEYLKTVPPVVDLNDPEIQKAIKEFENKSN